MILPYLLRLVCVCLASFYVVNLLVSAVVWAVTPAVLRIASGLRAAGAASFLLTIRLLPAIVAALVTAGICAPGYLWLEAESGGEQVGVAFLAAALFAAAGFAAALWRSSRAVHHSRRAMANIQRYANTARVGGSQLLVVDAARPLLMLSGLIRPRVAVSQSVLDALSAEQLDAAVRHESAHGWSKDNLKRLLILLAPRPLPVCASFRRLERAWSRYTEWAADDRAADGDTPRGLALAEALLCMARLGTALPQPPLCASLLPDPDDLAVRVERLLAGCGKAKRGGPVWAAAVAVAFATAALVIRPGTLAAAHAIVERLVH